MSFPKDLRNYSAMFMPDSKERIFMKRESDSATLITREYHHVQQSAKHFILNSYDVNARKNKPNIRLVFKLKL